MFGDMQRKLRETEANIDRLIDVIRYYRFEKSKCNRTCDYYKKRIDSLASCSMDDDIRWRICNYASKIECYVHEIHECNVMITKYTVALKQAEQKRDEIVKWLKHYDDIETSRCYDELDYILLIEKNGYIHGTKL